MSLSLPVILEPTGQTNQRGRDAEVPGLRWCTRFHGNGKKTRICVPTEKGHPEGGRTAWPSLGQAAHVLPRTSRWDSRPSRKATGSQSRWVLLPRDSCWGNLRCWQCSCFVGALVCLHVILKSTVLLSVRKWQLSLPYLQNVKDIFSWNLACVCWTDSTTVALHKAVIVSRKESFI